MTPSELAEIQRELGLDDAGFTAALELGKAVRLAELKSGDRRISSAISNRAEWLLDDWRYACLILEKKIRPQYEELIKAGEKPARIALVTELDHSKPEYREATRPETRLTLYRQVDRLAKIFFETEGVEVVTRVEFVTAPAPVPGEEAPRELSILGVRVEVI